MPDELIARLNKAATILDEVMQSELRGLNVKALVDASNACREATAELERLRQENAGLRWKRKAYEHMEAELALARELLRRCEAYIPQYGDPVYDEGEQLARDVDAYLAGGNDDGS